MYHDKVPINYVVEIIYFSNTLEPLTGEKVISIVSLTEHSIYYVI